MFGLCGTLRVAMVPGTGSASVRLCWVHRHYLWGHGVLDLVGGMGSK